MFCAHVTSCFIQWTLLLWANLCGNVSPPRSTCHHIALAFWAKCSEGRYQISRGDETEMDCESKRQRQVAGGDSPHVPLHSCCQQQDGLVSLCYLESLTQQGNSSCLHYDGFTHKRRGSVSNRRTCFVIL